MCITGFHFRHRALDVPIGNDGIALRCSGLAHVGDDLDDAAAAVGTKKFVRVIGSAMEDSQNVQGQHPPNQEEGDNGHDNVANPLAQSLRLSSIFHVSGLVFHLALAGLHRPDDGGAGYDAHRVRTGCDAPTRGIRCT